jgi:hypothetical protein
MNSAKTSRTLLESNPPRFKYSRGQELTQRSKRRNANKALELERAAKTIRPIGDFFKPKE